MFLFEKEVLVSPPAAPLGHPNWLPSMPFSHTWISGWTAVVHMFWDSKDLNETWMKHESTKHYSGGLDTKRRTCAKKKEREPPIYLATCNYQAASSFTFHITPYSSIVVYCLSSSCTSCMVLYSLPLEVIPSGSMFKKKEQKHELPAVPCHCLPPRSKRTTSKSVRTVGIYIYIIKDCWTGLDVVPGM